MYGKHYSSYESSPNHHISYTKILNSVDQFQLWSWFLGYYVSEGQMITNPMRVDIHANCWLSWGLAKPRYVVLNDFADRRFHGFTIFDALIYAYGLTFNDAMEKIYEEFVLPGNIALQDQPGLVQKKDEFNFILQIQPWTLSGRDVFIPEDKLFWSQYEITSQQLQQDNVKSNRLILFNSRNKPQQLNQLSVTPSYTYLFDSGTKKCYNPYHKTNKWISTATEEDVGGWNTLDGSDLVITKSYKDWRVLKNSGYNSIWLQNEGCKIPFDKLIKLQSIKRKFILFDNDAPGIQASQQLAEYANHFDDSYIPIWFDAHMPKDSADIVKSYSSRVLEQELANIGIQ